MSDGGYIRGAAGGAVSRRTVANAACAFVLVLVAIAAVVLTIQAADANSRRDRLNAHGVAVNVTVSSCLGLASGTGITVAGYQCRGSFELDGRSYSEVIGGDSTVHASGDVVHAVVDPGDPSNVSADITSRASWRAYLPAIITLGCLAILGAGWFVVARRMSRR